MTKIGTRKVPYAYNIHITNKNNWLDYDEFSSKYNILSLQDMGVINCIKNLLKHDPSYREFYLKKYPEINFDSQSFESIHYGKIDLTKPKSKVFYGLILESNLEPPMPKPK